MIDPPRSSVPGVLRQSTAGTLGTVAGGPPPPATPLAASQLLRCLAAEVYLSLLVSDLEDVFIMIAWCQASCVMVLPCWTSKQPQAQAKRLGITAEGWCQQASSSRTCNTFSVHSGCEPIISSSLCRLFNLLLVFLTPAAVCGV